jgi:thioesterase domain-containing protein
MQITTIPFVKKTNIEQTPEGNLTLNFDQTNQNHLQTIHAGALFTLAESASGEALQTSFPEFVGKVLPLLRDSEIKFKKPATKSVTAFATIPEESISKFKEQFQKKNRSSIRVNVVVKDSEENVICSGVFHWFIQKVKE